MPSPSIDSSPPRLVAVAGPNGAGKSTTAPGLIRDRLGISEFVNADVIAQGLSGFNQEAAAVAAGRVMLSRIRSLAAQRSNFAFESTLAGRGVDVLEVGSESVWARVQHAGAK